jgi:acetolactate synthase regulatory subunit
MQICPYLEITNIQPPWYSPRSFRLSASSQQNKVKLEDELVVSDRSLPILTSQMDVLYSNSAMTLSNCQLSIKGKIPLQADRGRNMTNDPLWSLHFGQREA